VSWAALIGLGCAAYVLKALGPMLLGEREIRLDVAAVLSLLSIPLLGALILVQTFDGGERLVLDARLPALGVAAVLVWRRAPFLVVVLAAAATAAVLRAL
jgi:branched-subunit amino acid transport protein